MLLSKELSDKITSLIKLDIDAVAAYNQAIDEIDVTDIRDHLVRYRDDHQRHVDVLSAVMRDYGEKPPERSKDVMGYLLEGFTAIRSSTGTMGALKAMESNEKVTNRKYSEALSWKFDQQVHDIIEKNYFDEKTHLEYIQQTLSEENMDR